MNSSLNMSIALSNYKIQTTKRVLRFFWKLQEFAVWYFQVKYEVFLVNEQGFKGALFVLVVFRSNDQFRSGNACKIAQFVFLYVEGRRFCCGDAEIINLSLPKHLFLKDSMFVQRFPNLKEWKKNCSAKICSQLKVPFHSIYFVTFFYVLISINSDSSDNRLRK